MRWLSNFVFGLISGALLGGLLGLLLAPARGDETRQQMRDYAERLQREVQDAAESKRFELETELSRLRRPQPEMPVEEQPKG